MYKQVLFTKESALGPYAEPPASLIRPGHHKLAELDTPLHPQLQQYIQGLKPQSGKTYVLVSAMGAGEWYGDNINGDYFPYKELVTHTPDWLDLPVFDKTGRKALAAEIKYGYPTFYMAHAFKHHVNKDPARSFGDIECAVWNEKMKRVELVISLEHSRCEIHGAEDILNRICDGEYPDVSMGCRVPYDVCSICGNKAKTKEEYCEHINNRRMNRDPLGNGQRPYMINVFPRFFDLSFVFIGADRTARTLMKIAGVEDPVFNHIQSDLTYLFPKKHDSLVKAAHILYEAGYDPYDRSTENMVKVASLGYGLEIGQDRQVIEVSSGRTKEASVQHARPKMASMRSVLRKVAELQKHNKQMKLSDIIKYVVPHPNAKEVSRIEGGEPDLPESLQDDLGKAGLNKAINSTARRGIVMKPGEFLRVALQSAGMGNLADKLRGVTLPSSDKVEMPCDVDPGSESSDLDRKLALHQDSRSIQPIIIRKRVIRIMMIPERSKGLTGAPSGELEKSPLLDKVSAAYNGYRLWLIANGPELGLTSDEGADMISAFGTGELSKSASVDKELTAAYLQHAHWQAGGPRG